MKKSWDRAFLRSEGGRILRYLSVGAMNSGVFIVFSTLGSLLRWHYSLYTALGYTAGITCSYLMNRSFTFKVPRREGRALLLRFLLVNVTLLGVAELIQFLLIEKAGFPPLPGILGGMVVYTSVGYVFNRTWVFRIRETPAV